MSRINLTYTKQQETPPKGRGFLFTSKSDKKLHFLNDDGEEFVLGVNAQGDGSNGKVTDAVDSFNGRDGDVVPQSGDYSKDMVGLENVLNETQVINKGNVKSIESGTSNNKPNASTNGRLYIETDTGTIYFDNGVEWKEIGSGAQQAKVSSVNGQTGDVTLTTDSIQEGSTNLYYSDTKVSDKVINMFQEGTNISLNKDLANQTITINAQQDSSKASLNAWKKVSGNYSSSSGDRILFNTSDGTGTLFLPPNPDESTEVHVADPNNGWGTNTLSIDGNGNNIENETSFNANVGGMSFSILYNGTQYIVRFVSFT